MNQHRCFPRTSRANTRLAIIDNVSSNDDPQNNEASRSRALPTKMTTGDVAVVSDDITSSDNVPSEGQRVDIDVTVRNTRVIDVKNVKVRVQVDNVNTTSETIHLIE